MIISFTNVIGAIRNVGKSIITDGLKMWLGFKTSEPLGREEVVNGDFDGVADGTDVTTLSNWFVNGTPTSTDVVGKEMVIVAAASGDGTRYNLATIVGSTYYLTFNASGDLGASGVNVQSLGDVSTLGGVGRKTFTALSTTTKIYFRAGNNEAGTTNYDNISVKELTQITPDKSGNSNVGKLFTGKALDFNGSTDYVDLDGFAMSGTTATFAFWVNPSNDGQNYVFSSTPDRITIGNDSNGAISIFESGGFKDFGLLPLNTYSRCVVVIDGVSATCFVNGIQLGSEVTLGANIDLSSPTSTVIGRHPTVSSGLWDGNISDFQIYNAVWSASDIAYDYAKPNHLVTDNSSTSLTVSNLKGYWALSEGAGSIAYDSSGGGVNGTIGGATYTEHETRIPQLGMMDWAKGSNLEPTSDSGTYGSSPASEILTQSPLQSNTAIIPVPSASANRYQYDFAGGVYSSGQVLTYSWYSKQITTPLLTFVGNLNPKTSSWVNCTLVTAAQEIESDINGWDRFSISFSIDDGSLSSIMRPYFGDVVGIGNQSVAYWGHQLEESSSAGNFILTDGAVATDVTTIQNPSNKGYDIFGNSLRLREHSFNLDGSGYAEVVDDVSLDFGTGAFSCDGWVKFKHVNTSSINCIYSNGGQIDTASTFGVGVTSNKIVARVSSTALSSSTTFSEGEWVYFALTRDGSGACKLYINDDTTPEGTASDADSVSNSSEKRIGRDSSDFRVYQNLIDDVRVYNIELTSDEINNNYNAGLSAHSVGSSFSDDFSSDYGN